MTRRDGVIFLQRLHARRVHTGRIHQFQFIAQSELFEHADHRRQLRRHALHRNGEKLRIRRESRPVVVRRRRRRPALIQHVRGRGQTVGILFHSNHLERARIVHVEQSTDFHEGIGASGDAGVRRDAQGRWEEICALRPRRRARLVIDVDGARERRGREKKERERRERHLERRREGRRATRALVTRARVTRWMNGWRRRREPKVSTLSCDGVYDSLSWDAGVCRKLARTPRESE